MLFPIPIQYHILEDCDVATLRISSLVCKDWCVRSHMIIAKKLWGTLAICSTYEENWIELVRDKNCRNKPQLIGSDLKVYAPDQRFAQIFSVPSVSIQDSQSIQWIFKLLAAHFKTAWKNVYDREFVTINELAISEKQRKISQLKRTLEYDMYDGTSRNDITTVKNAVDSFLSTLTNGSNNLEDISLFDSICKFPALFTFEMVAICEKSERVGIICIGDNECDD